MVPEHLKQFADPHNPVKVLDQGFVYLVDVMGTDSSIVQAARVSYGDGTKKVREDRGLLRYLLRKHHTSPFEMCEIKFHCRMPIFVARQWVRHRTASLNEMSARYSALPADFYVPEPERVQAQAQNNKQGSGDTLEPAVVDSFLEMNRDSARVAFEAYQRALGHNVARELARIVTPVSTYTEWYWKMDLHNLLHFLRLRLDPHAQYEIRVFAEAIAEIVKAWVPLTWEAFEDYRLNSMYLSRQEIEGLRVLLRHAMDERSKARRSAQKLGVEVLGAEATPKDQMFREALRGAGLLTTKTKKPTREGREFVDKLTKLLGPDRPEWDKDPGPE